MIFLSCDGEVVLSGEHFTCSGALHEVTSEEITGLTALTWDDVAELQGEIIVLFATVFGFLILRKLL